MSVIAKLSNDLEHFRDTLGDLTEAVARANDVQFSNIDFDELYIVAADMRKATKSINEFFPSNGHSRQKGKSRV